MNRLYEIKTSADAFDWLASSPSERDELMGLVRSEQLPAIESRRILQVVRTAEAWSEHGHKGVTLEPDDAIALTAHKAQRGTLQLPWPSFELYVPEGTIFGAYDREVRSIVGMERGQSVSLCVIWNPGEATIVQFDKWKASCAEPDAYTCLSDLDHDDDGCHARAHARAKNLFVNMCFALTAREAFVRPLGLVSFWRKPGPTMVRHVSANDARLAEVVPLFA